MKRKNILLLFSLLVVGIGFIFSLISMGRLGTKKIGEQKQISVITRGIENNSARQQGMEQAAADMNVELRFLVLGQADSANEQSQLLAREVESEADAIILIPHNTEMLAESVAQASRHTVVVTMESNMVQSGATACISVDNVEVGQSLGEMVLHGVPKGGNVVLLDSAPQSSGISQRVETASEVLKRAERNVLVYQVNQPETVESVLVPLLAQERVDAVVAFETYALEQAAAVLKTASNVLLYGVGGTNAVALYLEQSVITAAVVQNDFAEGYLAVEAAASALYKKGSKDNDAITIEFLVVRKENMYNDDIQKHLFPVTR